MKDINSPQESSSGKLTIGDNWNAITIIALSQNNPLKAIAEFVENSIDAGAKNITILRGKEKGKYYLKIVDDGEGIDDFTYVATHIGDSIKKRLKKQGATGIQGEFGIGLLSFWTVGEELQIMSAGKEKIVRRMTLVKGNPGYSIQEVKKLFHSAGTELFISPILPGVRQLTGEKIQNYLASELRDRITRSNVFIKIIDRAARKELVVEPRKFKGRLLHHLPSVTSPLGEIYYELYLNEPSADNMVGLYKQGTRIFPSMTKIEQFSGDPWNSGYFEGIIDASFLQLTPGTRDGIIYDHAFESFLVAMESLNNVLSEIVEGQRQAAEDTASKKILHRISKALKEALFHLPLEEYGWLSVQAGQKEKARAVKRTPEETAGSDQSVTAPVYMMEEPGEDGEEKQREFFEIPGALYSAVILPSRLILRTGQSRKLKIVARDKRRIQLDGDMKVWWEIVEGEGRLNQLEGEFVEYTASEEPGMTIVKCMVEQGDILKEAECIITVTEELLKSDLPNPEGDGRKKGLPGYTYRKAPGELWRSRYDEERALIIINNGHADFVFASKQKGRKLRYITKLFAKELVLANFPEANKEKLLERMIELQLYTEENL